MNEHDLSKAFSSFITPSHPSAYTQPTTTLFCRQALVQKDKSRAQQQAMRLASATANTRDGGKIQQDPLRKPRLERWSLRLELCL